jgi:hypothetical protein
MCNNYPFYYHLGNNVITCTDCVEDLAVWLDKLYFHHHVNYIFAVASKLLGLINFTRYNFPSLDNLLVFTSRLFGLSLNILLSPGTISQQQIPINLKVHKINLYICATDDFITLIFLVITTWFWSVLGLRTLHSIRRHLYALFLINVLIILLIASLFWTLLVNGYPLN